MHIEEYIAARVKELCEKYHVSKYRLAQLTGMSQTAVGNIMKMESIPTIPTLEKILPEKVGGRIYQKSKERSLKRGMNWEEMNEEFLFNLSAV